MSNYLEEALKLARLGYKVFPCEPNHKLPFIPKAPNGCNSATLSEMLITAWWGEFPNCNIGLKCENCLVIDVDRKNGKDGTKDISNVIRALGPLPPSPMSVTPTGGYHLFFAKPDVEIVGKTGVLWENKPTGIDIRIGNQYIVAPPSFRTDVPQRTDAGPRLPSASINRSALPHSTETTTGSYVWKTPLVKVDELPKLPDRWIDEFLPLKNAKPILVLPATHSLILPQNYSIADRCRLYLDKVDPCIAGQAGDAQLFKAACVIFWDFGLPESEGMRLFQEYNARCQPPWPESRLRYKMNQALQFSHEKPRGFMLEQEKPRPDYGVDLSGFTTAKPVLQPLEEELDEEEKKLITHTALVDPGCVPDRLLRVPGFVGEVMDFSLENAPCAVPTTAFCGAMALQSFLCGRKVREPGDLRTNLYLLALVGASSGKDYPRKVNSHIMFKIGEEFSLGDKFVSGEGVQDSLFLQPNMLYQNDEIDGLLFALNDKNRGTHVESIMGTLLTMYTSASTIYPMRRKSGQQHPGFIDQPHLTIFGTATPQFYYAALSERMMSNGFFARMIIVDSDKRPFTQDAKPAENVSERIIETARWWKAFQPGEIKGNLSSFHPTPLTIPFDDTSTRQMIGFRRYADMEYSKAEDRGDVVAMSVWGRANENARKLALIYSCSENYRDPHITVQATNWAAEFVTHQIKRQLFKANEHTSKTRFHALCKEAIRHLRQWQQTHGAKGMPKWLLKRHLSVTPREFEDMLTELDAQRYIQCEKFSTKGRPRELISLLSHKT